MRASRETSGVSAAYCLEVSLKKPHLPLVSANRNTSLIWRGESLDPAFYWKQRRTLGGWGGRGGEKGRGSRTWGGRGSALIRYPLYQKEIVPMCAGYTFWWPRSPRLRGWEPAGSAPRSPHHLPWAGSRGERGMAAEPCAGSRGEQGGRALRSSGTAGNCAVPRPARRRVTRKITD